MLQWIFLIGIFLGLDGCCSLARWRLRSGFDRDDANGLMPARVIRRSFPIIVPAYNEELVIANTIRSLLASDYQEL